MIKFDNVNKVYPNGLHALKLELKQRDLSSPVALITKNQSESDFLYQNFVKVSILSPY